MNPKDFPLCWPEGRGRTAPESRIAGRFKAGWKATYDALISEAEKLHEGPREVAISTCVPLDKHGRPIVSLASGKIADPGVALYVWRGGRPYAVACDTYLDVGHNLRAVLMTVRALRVVQRHGTSALLAQSMVGHALAEVGAPEDLRDRLRLAEHAFSLAGGRGVELADEIDEMRRELGEVP